MENREIDEIFTGLFTVFPLFRKKISKIGDDILLNQEISRAHVSLMENIRRNGPSTMTDLGKMQSVSKPNITILVDKLVKLEMVKRVFDENDRRVIYIELTDKGLEFLERLMESMKVDFGISLKNFSNEEIELFKETIKNMKVLFEKMEE